jgi:spore cortex formation protein SpoVR/YcgB (stage V sporulation)
MMYKYLSTALQPCRHHRSDFLTATLQRQTLTMSDIDPKARRKVTKAISNAGPVAISQLVDAAMASIDKRRRNKVDKEKREAKEKAKAKTEEKTEMKENEKKNEGT